MEISVTDATIKKYVLGAFKSAEADSMTTKAIIATILDLHSGSSLFSIRLSETKKHINRNLHAMQEDNQVRKTVDSPPTWQVIPVKDRPKAEKKKSPVTNEIVNVIIDAAAYSTERLGRFICAHNREEIGGDCVLVYRAEQTRKDRPLKTDKPYETAVLYRGVITRGHKGDFATFYTNLVSSSLIKNARKWLEDRSHVTVIMVTPATILAESIMSVLVELEPDLVERLSLYHVNTLDEASMYIE